jgi:hypothetical protein
MHSQLEVLVALHRGQLHDDLLNHISPENNVLFAQLDAPWNGQPARQS